ncbi:MAG: type II CRISPR RNA-guided endonuclease Cas9 [candidate division WOR-3 bacterium]
MAQKILAIDPGQSSIGWIIRNTENNGIEQFCKYGVLSFNKGVGEKENREYSLAAERTKYRSVRRLYQSRKYKLWTTLEKLKANDYCPIQDQALKEWSTYNKNLGLKRKYPVWDKDFENWIKLDFNGDNKPDFESPYQLRKYLMENRLDFSSASNRYMLGRALYHIAQHRAFKSSKKVKIDDDQKDSTDIGAEKKKKENLKKEFLCIGLNFDENKTIGQLLAEAESFFKKRGYGRIRNELHPNVTRKMLQLEVEQMFKFQFGEQWLSTFEKLFGVTKIYKCSIFWQRPLRSQKSAVGKCTLEKSKFRCPVSHPQFEIFRAWSLINNIKYRTSATNEFKPLTLSQKNKLYQDEFIKAGDFYFTAIRKWLIKELQDKNIVLNYSDKTNISGSPTIYYLTKLLGENWEYTRIEHEPIERKKRSDKEKKYISQKNYYSYEDIWHVAFQLDDEEEIEEIARKKFKFNDDQVSTYIKLFKNMAVDYSRLSLKAIKNINYFLKKGLIYTDAVFLAKIPDLLGNTFYNAESESLIINSLNDLITQNRKKRTILNITNSLIAEYKINHFHERDYDYILKNEDISKIKTACENTFGKEAWEKFSETEKRYYVESVINEFQGFFKDRKREFKKLPKLIDDLKSFLMDNFEFLQEKKLNKLYHPSAIEIYPKLSERERAQDGKLYLQSPKTSSWKNPMAMRVLQELRLLINFLIKTDQIDEETKIVIEIPRELNDANKRKAYQIWQKRKEEENKQFALAIAELIKHNTDLKADAQNDSDIGKFRMWFEQCFDETVNEFTDKGPNEFKVLENRNRKGEESTEEMALWSENRYNKINTSIWFKILRAKDDVLTKYKLWQEQKALCLYTGKIIKITDLFSEDTIDIEHTLPYSRALDNSLENKTVCYKEYNRKIKQNRMPFECPNYDEILERIKPWKEKIENIKRHLEYWKNETKKASTKNRKDQCIIEKHLWSWELQYWENKVNRFEAKEIKSGFVNAQLVDTQIISKYAFHYLKSLFENVQVQKGQVTTEYAKILGIRDQYKPKVRDKHSHHVIDALILSLVPDSTRLKSIMEKYAEIQELEKIKEYVSANNRDFNNKRIELLKSEIKQLLIESRIPINSLHKAIQHIKENVLTITPVKTKILATAKKKIKKGKLKGKYATGDTIRGQLHKESLYGKIKLVERDPDGKPLRNENGEWIWATKDGSEQFAFVRRVPVDEELKIENIIDPHIKAIFKEAVKSKSLKEMKKEGGLIYNNPKTGKTIRIRHVRCFQKPTDLLEIKTQSHKSKHDYKNFYYADNAENIYYGLYEDALGKRTFEMLNLFNATKIKRTTPVKKIEDLFPPEKEIGRGKNKTRAKLKAVLYRYKKVIFYKETMNELKELDEKQISSRIYFVYSLYGKTDGRIQFQHHLEARADKDIINPNTGKKLVGFSTVDFNDLKVRYLLSPSNFNFAIEGKDFNILYDGSINWL